MQRCMALSSFGTSKENTGSLAFALHPTPAGIHELTVELGLPQTLVDGIMCLAHPLPQLWASLCGRCMVPASKMGTVKGVAASHVYTMQKGCCGFRCLACVINIYERQLGELNPPYNACKMLCAFSTGIYAGHQIHLCHSDTTFDQAFDNCILYSAFAAPGFTQPLPWQSHPFFAACLACLGTGQQGYAATAMLPCPAPLLRHALQLVYLRKWVLGACWQPLDEELRRLEPLWQLTFAKMSFSESVWAQPCQAGGGHGHLSNGPLQSL